MLEVELTLAGEVLVVQGVYTMLFDVDVQVVVVLVHGCKRILLQRQQRPILRPKILATLRLISHLINILDRPKIRLGLVLLDFLWIELG